VYRKSLFALHDERTTSGEALASYCARTYSHLIPLGVEAWEYSEDSKECSVLHQKDCENAEPVGKSPTLSGCSQLAAKPSQPALRITGLNPATA
jgi:hypothetical protein